MFLSVDFADRIENPTPSQIAEQVRKMPDDVDVLILDADAEHYLQAASHPAGGIRVEWRQEATHRFMIVPVERAEEAFLAFGRWDEATLRSFPWRRLTAFNDPYRALEWLLWLLVAFIVFMIWAAFR